MWRKSFSKYGQANTNLIKFVFARARQSWFDVPRHERARRLCGLSAAWGCPGGHPLCPAAMYFFISRVRGAIFVWKKTGNDVVWLSPHKMVQDDFPHPFFVHRLCSKTFSLHITHTYTTFHLILHALTQMDSYHTYHAHPHSPPHIFHT